MIGGEDVRKIPATLEEARRLKLELANKVTDLQAQLANRDMTHAGGRRLSSREYWQWRKQAQFDLASSLSHLRFAKMWLHNLQEAHSSSDAGKAERDEHRKTRRVEFMEFLMKELEVGIDAFIEYRNKGIPDIDSRLAVLDELRRRCEGFNEEAET